MCVQCAAAAATTVGAASGIRAVIQARVGHRLGEPAMRWVTLVLMGFAVLGAGLAFGGSG